MSDKAEVSTAEDIKCTDNVIKIEAKNDASEIKSDESTIKSSAKSEEKNNVTTNTENETGPHSQKVSKIETNNEPKVCDTKESCEDIKKFEAIENIVKAKEKKEQVFKHDFGAPGEVDMKKVESIEMLDESLDKETVFKSLDKQPIFNSLDKEPVFNCHACQKTFPTTLEARRCFKEHIGTATPEVNSKAEKEDGKQEDETESRNTIKDKVENNDKENDGKNIAGLAPEKTKKEEKENAKELNKGNGKFHVLVQQILIIIII